MSGRVGCAPIALRDLILRVVPKRTAKAMEAESRAWLMTCTECGHSVSVWDAGGLRYKAAGEPRRRARCGGCGNKTWQRVHRASD